MIIYTDILARAIAHANDKLDLGDDPEDMHYALSCIEHPMQHTSDWAEEVREFVRHHGGARISFDDYQGTVMALAIYPGRGTTSMHGARSLAYTVLGLAGEAGEVSENLKKAIRDDGGDITPERRQAMLKELGDVLWYVTACATDLGSSLREVAETNAAKLLDRAARGKLQGSGSDR